MENITKDILNEILYDEKGDPTEDYNTVMDILKPYLSNIIQIGGGIELEETQPIDSLFDSETGEMKDVMLGGFLKGFRFVAIFYKQFESEKKKIVKFVEKDLYNFHVLVKNLSEPVFESLGLYYTYNKMDIFLNIVLQNLKIAMNESPSEITERNIKELERQLRMLESNAKRAEKSTKFHIANFIKRMQNKDLWQKFTFGILGKSMKNKLFNKLDNFSKNLEKINKNFNKKFSIIEDKLAQKQAQKGSDKLSSLGSKIITFKKEFSKAEEILGKGKDYTIDILNIYDSINKKLTLDGKDIIYNKDLMEKHITPVFDNLDELTNIAYSFKSNFDGLEKIFDAIRVKIADFSTTKEQGWDDKYVKIMKTIIDASHNGLEISTTLHENIKEISELYISKTFPSPDFNAQLIAMEKAYDFVKRYYTVINSKLAPFYDKGSKQLKLNAKTIAEFVTNIDKGITGGNLSIVNNSNFFLYSYDLYYANKKIFTEPVFARVPTNIRNLMSAYLTVDYGNTDMGLINLNKTPGHIMITQQLDYTNNDKLIKEFKDKINFHYGIRKPQFIGFYYNDEFHIYMLSFIRGTGIRMIRLERHNAKKISDFGLYELDILGFRIFTFVPENLYDPVFNNISSADDETLTKEQEQEVEKLKKKPYMLPFFIRFDKLEHKNNHNPVNSTKNVKVKHNIYLPYDTIFGKILLPYMNIENKNNVFKTNFKNNDGQYIFSKNAADINMMAINSRNFTNKIRNNVKSVLFFLDDKYQIMNDANSYISMSSEFKEEVGKIYQNYFYSYQMFIDSMINIEDFTNIDINLEYKPEYMSNIKLFRGLLNNDVLYNYFDSKIIDRRVLVLKNILFHAINRINPAAVTMSGVDVLKIKSQPLTARERQVFDAFTNNIEYLGTNLLVFQKLSENIKSDEFNKLVGNIRFNTTELQKYEDKFINEKILNPKFKVPAFGDAETFNRTSRDNPENLYTANTKKLYETIKDMSDKVGVDSNLLDSTTELIVSIRNGIALLPKTDLKVQLENIKNNKNDTPVSLRKVDVLEQYSPMISTENGAKLLVAQLSSFRDKMDKSSGIDKSMDLYPNSSITYADLGRIYKDIDESIYKLVKYLDITTRLPDDYKKARKLYKPFFDAYVENMNEQIKTAQEDRDKKRYGRNFSSS